MVATTKVDLSGVTGHHVQPELHASITTIFRLMWIFLTVEKNNIIGSRTGRYYKSGCYLLRDCSYTKTSYSIRGYS